MAIERIKPGYYYLNKHDVIDYVPDAVIGTGKKAEKYFKDIGAYGFWYVTDSHSQNKMLQEISKLRARIYGNQRW